MPALRYLHLDVFAASYGGGNHLGVVIGADQWSSATMQSFARWTNLVETTFLLAPTVPQASYRVRIFTPHKEIAFAGHPSVGSAHAVLECGLAQPRDGQLLQECGVGLLPIRVEGSGDARQLSLRTPVVSLATAKPDWSDALQAALHGAAPGTLAPALADGGRRWWLVECADEATLRQWQPDHAAIARLAKASDSMGICAWARCHGHAYQLAVRAFGAGAGITEDPASGAANGLLAAYLRQVEPDGPLARGYLVSQGREVGHDAHLSVLIDGEAIWVGGRTHTVTDGVLRWPGPA
jgi:PhzF family phenazine biosynthesis protein